ncbi:MAG: DNA (cytosine-5-)-methyltransferase [Caldilineaceae bacterium]|nr:DNA (cytosine-5-)-methyltransferase [Caldilineaceae bacterium]
MKTVSLFSGCGGSDLGAKQAGAEVVFAMDISRNAVLTYKAHLELLAAPDCDVRHGNVCSLTSLPSCELLLGCYPCQSFSMGGHRTPEGDEKALLYQEFARCLELTDARFAVVENVAGLAWLDGGRFLQSHLAEIGGAGKGYVITHAVLQAENFGVPARRRRLFLVAVRSDQGVYYHFPQPTHGPKSENQTPWTSHGDAIAHLPADPQGEYYTRGTESFSWWYMSRNRKRPWNEPSYTILGNWRHTPLHPASPTMHMVSSDLKNGWKQTWEFTNEYDHLDVAERPKFQFPRRLSWREAACLQTFPDEFEPSGSVASKFTQIGNAVPPLLMQAIVSGIVTGRGLLEELPSGSAGQVWIPEQGANQLSHMRS